MEYALVFPVFFMILYAAVGYGLVFAIQLSLQHAAEEGARAALRYQSTGAERLTVARTVTTTFLATWLPAAAYGTPTVEICSSATSSSCWDGTSEDDAPDCSDSDSTSDSDSDVVCTVQVEVSYDYASYALVPAIPGLGLLMPDTIAARASVLLEQVDL
ncbi:MAG: pilus assembly protein [Comamonas sp.]